MQCQAIRGFLSLSIFVTRCGDVDVDDPSLLVPVLSQFSFLPFPPSLSRLTFPETARHVSDDQFLFIGSGINRRRLSNTFSFFFSLAFATSKVSQKRHDFTRRKIDDMPKRLELKTDFVWINVLEGYLGIRIPVLYDWRKEEP